MSWSDWVVLGLIGVSAVIAAVWQMVLKHKQKAADKEPKE